MASREGESTWYSGVVCQRPRPTLSKATLSNFPWCFWGSWGSVRRWQGRVSVFFSGSAARPSAVEARCYSADERRYILIDISSKRLSCLVVQYLSVVQADRRFEPSLHPQPVGIRLCPSC